MNVDLLSREWWPLSLVWKHLTSLQRLWWNTSGKTEISCFWNHQTLVEDYCIPPTLPCVKKTAGQLFSGHFYPPTTDGTQNGGGNHLEDRRRLGFPEHQQDLDSPHWLFRWWQVKTHVRVETKACTPALFWTNNPYVRWISTDWGVIGSGSLPLKGGVKHRDHVFSCAGVFMWLSYWITAPIAGLGSKTCLREFPQRAEETTKVYLQHFGCGQSYLLS